MKKSIQTAYASYTNRFIDGFAWPVVSKRTGEKYSVKYDSGAFRCNCMGWRSHGKCKHIQQVYDILTSDEPDPKYQIV